MKTKVIFIFCLLTASRWLSGCQLPLNAQTWNTVGDSTQIINYDSVTHGGTVYVIKQIDSLLYVGGAFLYAGNIRINSIATWNGVNWDSLGNGMGQYGAVYDVCKFNNELYAGVLNGFGKFNGNSWTTVGAGFSTTIGVKALKYKGQLYLGGNDFWLNNTDLHNIASWDGSDYAGLNGGVYGPFSEIKALEVYNNELIAGGYFTQAGSIDAFNIASWDGSQWNDLDTGVSEDVYSMVVDTINNFLYIGGAFYNAGGPTGITALGIARWDGYQWDSLSNSMMLYPLAMKFYHNKLYVAGTFGPNAVTPSGDTLNYVAYWDKGKWNPLGKGLNNTVLALGVYQDKLYVGGCFETAGTDSAFGIARWYMPPDSSCDYLQAIIQPKNAVLKISDSTTVHFYNNIIHGSSWHWDFGDGTTDTVRMPVHTYAGTGVYNVSVIVTYQNCTDTAYTTITIVDDTGIKNKENNEEYLGQNIPNPFKNTTTIPYYVPQGSKAFLQITDTKGELVDEYVLQQGKNKIEISLSGFKAGIYFYSIKIDGVLKQTKKMVVQ